MRESWIFGGTDLRRLSSFSIPAGAGALLLIVGARRCVAVVAVVLCLLPLLVLCG